MSGWWRRPSDFHKERQCRVFNLSFGNEDEQYRGGRQFPLAEKLDQLARELDIVIVVAVVNASSVAIPEGTETRDAFQRATVEQLRTGDQRLCNPATAALALTVGAIARSDALGNQDAGEVALQDGIPGAPRGAPSPFTRTGPGYELDPRKAAVKPDLVHFGGNAALQVIAGRARWNTRHVLLGEPTIRREENGRFVGAVTGTSFSTPHVSHLAAVAASSLQSALGRAPSANVIRALLGSTAAAPPCGTEWIGDEDAYLRLVGYGMPNDRDVTASGAQRVRAVADDAIPEDTLHIYRVPVPESFLAERGHRGLVVSLAFDPPVRASRKEYLARTMWVEVLQGVTTAEVEQFRGRYIGDDAPRLPGGGALALRPPRTKLQWSTLQVRALKWSRRPQLRIAEGEETPVLHIVVGCQRRFATGLADSQRYGLVIGFWHESERVQLYTELQARVRVPATRARVRV